MSKSFSNERKQRLSYGPKLSPWIIDYGHINNFILKYYQIKKHAANMGHAKLVLIWNISLDTRLLLKTELNN